MILRTMRKNSPRLPRNHPRLQRDIHLVADDQLIAFHAILAPVDGGGAGKA